MANHKKVSINLTRDQRIQMANEMGVICDSLLLSELPKGTSLNSDDLGDNLFLTATKTHPIS